MSKIEVGSILSESWQLTKKNLVLVAVVLVFSLLSSIGSSSQYPDGYFEALSGAMTGDSHAVNQLAAMGQEMSTFNAGAYLTQILLSLCVAFLSMGLYNTMLQIAKGEMESFSLSGFSMPLITYFKAFVAELLAGILIALSVLCCIIPVFYVAPKVMFAYLYIIDGKTTDIIEAIKMNWEDSDGEVLNLILLGIGCILVTIVGLICCCCGVLVSQVVVYFAFILAYMALSSERKSEKNVDIEPIA